MTLEWGAGDALESGRNLTGGQLSGSLEASERREHFGIEVRGHMEFVTAEPMLD